MAELAPLAQFKGHKGAVTALCVLPNTKPEALAPATSATTSGNGDHASVSNGIDGSQSKADNTLQKKLDKLVEKVYKGTAIYSGLPEVRPAAPTPQANNPSPRRKKCSPVRVVTAGSDHTIKIWDPSMPNSCKTLEGHEDVVTCLATTTSGYLISGSHSFDCTVKVWDPTKPSSDALIKSFPTVSTEGQDHTSLIPHAVLSVCALEVEKKTRIVAGTQGGKLLIWDLETGEKVSEGFAHVDEAGKCHPVTGLAVLPNKYSFVSVGYDRDLKYWDGRSNTTIESLGFNSSPTGLSVCVDGSQTLVVASNFMDCLTVLNDAGGLEGVVEDHHLDDRYGKSTIALATLSVHGKAFAVQGRENGAITLSHVASGTILVKSQSDHHQGVAAVGLFVDSEDMNAEPHLRLRVVTGGKDGSVRFWSVVGNKMGPQDMMMASPVAAL